MLHFVSPHSTPILEASNEVQGAQGRTTWRLARKSGARYGKKCAGTFISERVESPVLGSLPASATDQAWRRGDAIGRRALVGGSEVCNRGKARRTLLKVAGGTAPGQAATGAPLLGKLAAFRGVGIGEMCGNGGDQQEYQHDGGKSIRHG